MLTLTATPWLQKTIESEAGDLQRTYTLWGMLATVNSHLLPLLILAIALLLAYAVVSIVLPPERMLPRSVLGWLAVVSAVGIVVNADNGYTPGAGAILTLVVCAITALLTSLSPLFRPVRGPVHDAQPRS